MAREYCTNKEKFIRKTKAWCLKYTSSHENYIILNKIENNNNSKLLEEELKERNFQLIRELNLWKRN